MSAYKTKWLELLKQQNTPGVQVMQHGQAIIMYVPSETSLKKFQDSLPATISAFRSANNEPAEWLKIILYNQRSWFQYILDPNA